jgi:RimJ/RimL family protein N-acetyltransferase
VRTARIELRWAVSGDAEAIAAYRGIEEVCRYVPFSPMDADEVRGRIEERWSGRELRDDGDALVLVVGDHDGVVLGDAMLRLVSGGDGVAEIGYVFDPDAGGRGLATEAAHAILHLAFDDLGVRRVIARVDAENRPSVALLERLGLRCEARLVENEWFKGRLGDELDFAVLAREWPALDAQRDRRWCLLR